MKGVAIVLGVGFLNFVAGHMDHWLATALAAGLTGAVAGYVYVAWELYE